MTIAKSVLKFVGVTDAKDLPAFAWPGGYPITYVVQDASRDRFEVCPKCAVEVALDPDDDEVVDAGAFYEGPDFVCDCGAVIESAYGDPDADEDGESEEAAEARENTRL